MTAPLQRQPGHTGIDDVAAQHRDRPGQIAALQSRSASNARAVGGRPKLTLGTLPSALLDRAVKSKSLLK
jgi:hypothetical protein